MKIVADKDIPFLKGVLEPFAEVVYLPGSAITAADVRDADALLTRTRTRCDAALLQNSHVKFIATATIGFDHIDRAWCEANDITVCTSAGCNARGVLQWVAAALAFLVESKEVASNEVTRPRQTLGVVGVGNVGKLVAEYAESWGFRVMKSDPPREKAERLTEKQGFFPLDQIAKQADIITFHVPLDATTRHLVNADFLQKTKPDAVILNSSRGAVVDQTAVRGHNYIFDVWENEPALDRQVLENALLATPHIAGYSAQGKANATAMAVNQLARHFGLPLAPIPLQTTARAIDWDEMREKMPNYFDIAAQSRALKKHPEDSEKQRDNYKYRSEFF